jgi:mycofactocin precursor
MEHDTVVADPAVDAAVDESFDLESQLIEDELLVEEISIDGMCGVY